MAPFNGIPTHSQQVALALIPKFAAAVSIVGSSYIVFDVLRTWTKNRCCKRRKNMTSSGSGSGPRRRSDTYHRLLLGMSVCDLFMSGGIFLSTWPMPREVPDVWGNVGTVQTCSAQGFFEQFGVSTVMYSASLSVYYLITIRGGRSAGSRARIRRMEPALHAVPLVFGLATAVASLALNLFNYGLWDCWIAPYPPGCKESWRNGGTTDCVRGNNASLYQWIFDLIPKWTSILIVTVNMVLVYLHVRKQEKASERWSSRASSGINISVSRPRSSTTSSVNVPSVAPSQDASQDQSQSQSQTQRAKRSSSLSVSRMIAHQSYLYVGALWVTWLPVIVLRGTQLASGVTYYWMLIWVSLSIPTQGMWNVLVYLRPRWLQKRREQKQTRMAAAAAAAANEEGSGSTFPIKAVHVLKDLSVAAADAVREGDIYDEEDDDERGTSGRNSHFDRFELREDGAPDEEVANTGLPTNQSRIVSWDEGCKEPAEEQIISSKSEVEDVVANEEDQWEEQ